MTILSVNSPAPGFESVDQDNKPTHLANFAGRFVVLYFYPKDDTPGCTIEANDFTSLAREFSALGAVIIGVSKDSCDSHRAFIDKFDLNLTLLADTSGELCNHYGVWQEKERDGRKSMGIMRSTFIIAPNGELVFVEYGVNPQGHAQQVLQTIKQLQTTGES